MTREADNLAELWHRFSTNTNAAQALAEMRAQASGDGEWDLAELLRNHEDEPVEDDDEISMRDAFDDLLAFYSCVEIAALSGLVPAQLPRAFCLDAANILCNRYVRSYYRTYYPLLLPDMLIARVGRVRARREQTRFELWPIFFEFLHICSILEDDPSVEMLLWFLDDGYHLGCDWDTTLAILTRPKRLVEALQRAPRRRNPAEQAVEGFRKFLGFCFALDDLLSRSSRFPLLRAAMWHYHAYWFRTIRGEVREALEGAFTALQSWLSSPAAKQLAEPEKAVLWAEATRSLRDIRLVVKRLTGTSYGSVLTRDQYGIRHDSVQAAQTLKVTAKPALRDTVAIPRSRTRRPREEPRADEGILEMAIAGYQRQIDEISARIADIKAQLGQRAPSRRRTAPAMPAFAATTTDQAPPTKRRTISKAGRARIAAAQRARWAAQKKQQAQPAKTAGAAKPKKKISAAGLKAIREATKRRWAAHQKAQEVAALA